MKGRGSRGELKDEGEEEKAGEEERRRKGREEGEQETDGPLGKMGGSG